ncbi:hypothetical protein EC915_101671 [Pseudomonas sp. LP_7_YM]|nr:hypothetical protein EC915_101671 [Pseudomonas sp. LP_7_YM]
MAVTLLPFEPRFFVKRQILELGVVNLDYFVTRFTEVGEAAFQSAEQADVADGLIEFLANFPDDGVDAPLAEFNAAAQWTVQ